jgi:hypothetical protein
MATAGMVTASTLIPRKDHAELTRLCAIAGITLSDHVRRCLALGQAQLEKEARKRREKDAAA